MRLRALRFDAFGPFTDVVLDLDAGGPALHVVHGHNEAGKSTALRGLVGLLYGIEERTRDAHLHPMPKLRISALLERADGSVLALSRKKGRKNTLLDSKGQPIDEAVLRAALGGVGRELFETVFGLTHESLQRGANALLEGRGDVGESLFDAGLGGRGVHHVLAELEKDADALFVARGQTRALNKAIADFKEHKRVLAQAGLSASAWHEQERGIVEQRELRDELDARLAASMAEQTRLARQARVVPKLEMRSALIAQREAMGDVPALPEDAREQRLAAQRRIEASTGAIARLEQDIERLRDRRGQLDIPEALARLPADAVEQLAQRLAAHRKAEQDLPKREAELRAAREDAFAILRRLGREPRLDEIEKLRFGPDRAARVRSLSSKRHALEARAEELRDQLVEREARLARARAQRDGAGEVEEPTALASALARAERQGDLDEQLRQARRDSERARSEAAGAARELGETGLEALAALVLPETEAGEIAAARDRIERERETLAARIEDAGRRREDIAGRLERLVAGGAVPTEAQLSAVRADRDVLWGAIRGGADAAGPPGDDFERALAEGDEVSDRLRREADRVSQHASLALDLRQVDAELAKQNEARAAIEARLTGLAERWRDVAARTGLTPPPLAQIEPWLTRVQAARGLAEDAVRAEHDRADLEARVRELAGALSAALRAHGADRARDHGEPRDADRTGDEGVEPRLGPSLDRARAVLERARAASAERKAAVGAVEALEADIDALRSRLATHQAKLEEWQRAWAESVAVLGLGADATVEEANELLSVLGELHQKADTAADRQRRIDAIRRDAELLARDAESVLARHLPDAPGETLSERIAALVDRHRTMRGHLDKRSDIDADLAEREAELEEHARAGAEAEARLGQLVREAGVCEVSELAGVEDRVEAARSLERRIRETEQTLVELGDGATLEALEEECTGLVLVDVRKRLAVVDDEIPEVRTELGAASRELGARERGLEPLRNRSAASAAIDLQASLAQIRDLAHRYARTRLAAAVLRREIERYREKNQGPILSRAATLFPQLTLGSFEGLRVGFGDSDRAVLRCVRAGGAEVEVDGLSTATRDQLYLALRLATLEHHAAHTEPLPFVLDDILVEFDDRRAHAALAALGDLARVTQVILFTHHARLVELAREAVPHDRLREHDLDALRISEDHARA